ncbi:MAG: P-II family nitrogen regulator [Clostridia bacterium]|nr:P-II family nitrogen regulator [Clostridia bacterium]
MPSAHQVIFCIVNAGFSDAVMDAAKKYGARGGTVIRARGTAGGDSERRYKITVSPEKEIVMILVNVRITDDILHAIYREVGLETDGQGIAFAVPVDQVVGLHQSHKSEQQPDPDGKEEEKT